MVSGVSNLRNHEEMEATVCFGLGALLLAIFLHQRRERTHQAAFNAWLLRECGGDPDQRRELHH